MPRQTQMLLQFFRYVIAGGITAAVELVCFLILLELGWWYLLANLIAFGVAVVVGFFAQKYFTFRNHNTQHVQQILKFLIIVTVGYILANFYLWIFIDILAWPPAVAKCLQLVLVMISNCAGQKWFTFR